VKKKPGFFISEGQFRYFLDLWGKACRAQGWTVAEGWASKDIDAKRKEVLAECGFASLKAVDSTGGFDRVKRRLMELDLSVAAGMETEADAEARRLRNVLTEELLPCLGVYHPNPEGYLLEIIRDKTRWRKDGQGPVRDIRLDDLSNAPVLRDVGGQIVESDSPLRQALSTLSRAVDDHRQAAGHSGHEMRALAGVRCKCAQCRSVSQTSSHQPF
jgi:hypothetical protein